MGIINEDHKRRAEEDAPEEEGRPAEESRVESSEEGKAGARIDEQQQGSKEREQESQEHEHEHEDSDEHHDVAPVASPQQLGAKRFVYAAYFAGAIGIAFLTSKVASLVWFKLQSWKPVIGEPRDEIIMPLAALIGAGAALYFWYRTRARQLAEEVAAEMSKVTWPSRTEVTNGTFVVIVTTIVSTVFFALMDKFWGFVTNLVYGGS
jgi:preprotein translocase subunit SecE